MDTLILIASTLMNTALIWVFLAKLPKQYWFVHPFLYNTLVFIVIVDLHFLANLVGLIETYFVDGRHQTTVLIYSQIFYLLYYAATWLITFGPWGLHQAIPDNYVRGVTGSNLVIMYGLTLALAAIFVFGAATGLFHTLGESHGRQATRLEATISLIFEARWLVAGLAIVAYAAYRRLSALLVAVAIVVMLFGLAMVSGGRGQALMAFYLVAVLVTVHKLRARTLAILGAGAATIAVLMVLLTIMRNDNDYRRVSSVSELAAKVSDAQEQLGDRIHEAAASMIWRFTIYANEFTLVVDNEEAGVSKVAYRFGSTRDVLKAVPRVLWPNKSGDTFNVYMSRYLYNRHSHNEFDCPVGRVAESYYVLGWLGVVGGVFYGIAFSGLFVALYARSGSLVYKAVYIQILFGYIVLGAANLTNRLPIVIQVLLLLTPLLLMMRRNERNSPYPALVTIEGGRVVPC